MKVLHLHVGHDKTGSSFLQNALRLSRATLRERHGLWYPPRGEGGAWSEAKATSGNGYGLTRDPAALREAAREAAGGGVVFSSEYLFYEILRADGFAPLLRAARAAGFEHVRALLFIRDPIGFLASSWQQQIKGEGSAETIEAHFAKRNVARSVARFLELAEAGVEVQVLNYSRHRRAMLEVTADWLGVPAADLTAPGVANVNRACTRAELELQRRLNAEMGPAAPQLARALSERLPDIIPDPILPGLEVQEAAWARMLPDIERVGARLPTAESYQFDARTPEAAWTYGFDDAQLQVIAETIAATAARLRARDVAVVGPSALLRALPWSLARALKRRLRPGRRPAQIEPSATR